VCFDRRAKLDDKQDCADVDSCVAEFFITDS